MDLKDRNKYSQLSMKDLVDAREMFHNHLINKKNVVATAIGRYLVRLNDLDNEGILISRDAPAVASNGQLNGHSASHKKEKRTLFNSIVTEFSWPCILVFVEEWEDEAKFVNNPTDIVPKTIYMPDGRTIPICVVETPKQENVLNDVDPDTLKFPTNLVGGGFPLLINSQGSEYTATVGCIVSDGHTYYVLTNKHVAGEEGQPISTIMGNVRQVVGYSSGKSLGKIPFKELYPHWNCESMQVNCDAGLIEIQDINRWKTEVLGIGEMGELYDLNALNMTLALIAQHTKHKGKLVPSPVGNVVAYGAASKQLAGEILAFFYRYKSLGGKEYVSDFLISGRNNSSLKTQHGDSGTVWLYEGTDKKGKPAYSPIALHWGMHQFIDDGKKQFPFALASNLTNICSRLEVDVVRNWNNDDTYTWGKVGHYGVGYQAVQSLGTGSNIGKFMRNNLLNISFKKTDISGQLDSKTNTDLHKNPDEGFCPLADVPDIIWKQSRLSKDGKSGFAWGRKGDENPNHYADVDAKTEENKNLFDCCDSVEKLLPETWIKYYDAVDVKDGKTTEPGYELSKGKRGLISFRVWQIFDYMTDAARKNKPAKFIFGAGVLAHYVGDACQPLHGSYMSDGDPADDKVIDYTAKVTSKKKDGTISHNKGDVYQKKVNPGSGVHVAYEDHMIDDNIGEILPKLTDIITDMKSNSGENLSPIITGQDAGFAVLTLMKKTQGDIAPKALVEAFKAAKADGKNMSAALYGEFGDATATVIARGSRYLGLIWKAAWDAPGNTITKLEAVSQDDLIALYRDPKELPSYHLDTIKFQGGSAVSNTPRPAKAATGVKRARKAKKAKV